MENQNSPQNAVADPPQSPQLQRSIVDKLFTPENVRILQSLGIGIIFFSAVALIRNQMWGGASDGQRLAMLFGGTLACYGFGYALYAWTSLRITGLGFLILGHLAIILDACAALVLPASGAALYPYAPASLWMLTFIVFTAVAALHARFLKEPLFDAFTVFGALAAWGCGVWWSGIHVSLYPAAMLPALALFRGVELCLADESTAARWSLRWWLKSSYTSGVCVLAIALPLAALWFGRADLNAHFAAHALAICAAGVLLLVDASVGAFGMRLGAPLLLSIGPLLAFAEGWPIVEIFAPPPVADWSMAFAIPGAAIVLTSLVLLRFPRGSAELRQHLQRSLSHAAAWGAFATFFGNVLAMFAHAITPGAPASLYSALAATVATFAFALCRRAPWAAWLTTASAGFVCFTLAARINLSTEMTPLLCMSVALGLHLFWWVWLRIRTADNPLAVQGTSAADAFALFGVAYLAFYYLGAILGSTHNAVAWAWVAAILYFLATTALRGTWGGKRFGLAIALHAPCISYAVYHHGGEFGAAAPWIAAAALAVLAIETGFWMRSSEQTAKPKRAVRVAGSILVGWSFLLALAQWLTHAYASAAAAFLLLGCIAAIVAIRSRLTEEGGGLTHELFMWLLLGCAASCGMRAVEFPIPVAVWALLGAIFLCIGMLFEALAGLILGGEKQNRSPSPFVESRHVAAMGIALFTFIAALATPNALSSVANSVGVIPIDATWRALFSATVLSIFLSFSTWSFRDAWNIPGRTLAAAFGYIILLPASYLCFLKAHSTGSSWGALWFLGLAPLLGAAVCILEREKQYTQALMARIGLIATTAIALVLAFAGNREHLSAVPALTFAAIGLQAFIARRRERSERLSHAICIATVGTVFFGLRALAGVPWSGEAFFLELPLLALAGVAMIAVGGALKFEEDDKSQSLLVQYGAALNLIVLGASFLAMMIFGLQLNALPRPNTARFDIFIACLLLTSAMTLAARRWLRFETAQYVAPILTVVGYASFILKDPPHAWEWCSLPAAAFIFLWARTHARAEQPSASHTAEISLLLGLASTAAIVPSFIQAVPYTPEGVVHAMILLATGFALVLGAMATRRKIPLLSGSAAIILVTLMKTVQWASHREFFAPLLGIGIGFLILGAGSALEAHMNRLIRRAVDRAKAEAQMFWVSWE